MSDRPATGAVLGMLAGWLPRQRWFPGRGGALPGLSVLSDVSLQEGNPALRHLIVAAPLPDGPAWFQVLVGYRPALPPPLAGALIGYHDGVACYDALHDPELADVLLRGIREQRQAGDISFVRAPAPAPELPAARQDSRLLGVEQSNSSLVFGDQAILKVLRRLFPGANPDLEVAEALARLGSARVPAPLGWIETSLDGEPVLLGVLSQFLAGASDGWTLALSSLAKAATFADDARLLGKATAELHADLAHAFGTREITRAELAGLASAMHAKLTGALELVPDLHGHEARIRGAYDAVAELPGPVTVQRIHGDYHLGQVLRAKRGWVALDFEGEPAVPLAVRRGAAPALRDVAGMLRSFDYAARHQQVRQPGRAGAAAADASEAADAAGVADAADAAGTWARRCQEAFRAGYAACAGVNPADDGALLRALMLEKAVYEVVYEYRHRPAWLSIPLDFVAAA